MKTWTKKGTTKAQAAVQNGVVYVGGGDAYWYALDAATGSILWKVYTGDNSATAGHYNWSSPLIYNGYAYIGVASLGDCPLVQGQLLRVDLNTHQIVNIFNVVPTGQVGGGIWTSPSLDTTTNTIYVTTGTEANTSQSFSQAFVALDASTLTVKSSWKLPEADAVPDSDFGNTPILFNDVSGNPMVAAINKNGYVYAFNRANLNAGPLWKQQIAVGGDCPQCGQGSISSGAFGNGALYLAGGETGINGQGYLGSIRSLDPATGNYHWQHGTPATIYGALAYTNGLVIDGAGSVLEVLERQVSQMARSLQGIKVATCMPSAFLEPHLLHLPPIPIAPVVGPARTSVIQHRQERKPFQVLPGMSRLVVPVLVAPLTSFASSLKMSVVIRRSVLRLYRSRQRVAQLKQGCWRARPATQLRLTTQCFSPMAGE